jgi:hypothetical protein
MKIRYGLLVLIASLLLACSKTDEIPVAEPGIKPSNMEVEAAVDTQPPALEFTEEQVEEYIRLFPYQDTYNYAKRYTGSDPSKLNTWVLGGEPNLVKAGEDKVVRMNNDTFYKMAFVDLVEGPVYIAATVLDASRFVSFQLMDDRNVNYHNIVFPNGEFTLYYGEAPDDVRGEGIEVPSKLSVVIVRVEVKNPGDADDVNAAEEIFRTITIEGLKPGSFPQGDVLDQFPDAVAKEAHYRMDEAFQKTPFRLTVVGPGRTPGDNTSYLSHSAGTKGGWGGPGTKHSSYETISMGRDQKPLVGANGTYSVTTEAPPVNAFWSLTVYDSERGGFLHPNKYDRYHINGTLAVENDDATYTFLFKQDCAEEDMNCLEVPAGRFDIAARYYLPTEAIRSGDWLLPPLELAN